MAKTARLWQNKVAALPPQPTQVGLWLYGTDLFSAFTALLHSLKNNSTAFVYINEVEVDVKHFSTLLIADGMSVSRECKTTLTLPLQHLFFFSPCGVPPGPCCGLLHERLWLVKMIREWEASLQRLRILLFRVAGEGGDLGLDPRLAMVALSPLRYQIRQSSEIASLWPMRMLVALTLQASRELAI